MKSNDLPVLDVFDIDELDMVYLSYDEPQKEEFWLKTKEIAPWAKRVDGVKGSDNAHKAAAAVSDTERFILIDGDNLLSAEFLDQQITINERNINAQFRWRARNNINGLYYGNGGLSCWTKEFVNNMRTHENSDPNNPRTNIEFCIDPQYWPMHNCYSTTYPNYSPKQAWRAGFREGVKMCARDGVMPTSKSNFIKHVWPRNLNNLLMWQSIGRDVENGWWAILGARLGTHYLMLREWDYREVQSFEALDALWELHKNDDEQISRDLRVELNRELGTNIIELESDGSKFFKDYISKNWRNRDVMTREIDVIREEEGW
jgi:hypothetical protein